MGKNKAEAVKRPTKVGFGTVFRNAIVSSLALILSIAWAGFATAVLFVDPAERQFNVDPDTLRNAVVLIVPILVLWIAAAQYKSSRNARDNIWAFHAELNSVREGLQSESQHYAEQPDYREDALVERSEAKPPAEAAFPSAEYRDPDPPSPAVGEFDEQSVVPADQEYIAQASLPLDTLIRALSFANDEDDAEGFEAVDRAMDDEATARLLEISQEVLHRLSTLDIFMDNLTLDIAQPEVWRFHAANAGRSEIATLGAVAEAEILESVASLLEQDAEFREIAENLIRLVNEQMPSIVANADSDQIAAFAHSRTIRAFILLGNIQLDA